MEGDEELMVILIGLLANIDTMGQEELAAKTSKEAILRFMRRFGMDESRFEFLVIKANFELLKANAKILRI